MPHFRLKLGGKTMGLPDGQHEVGRMSDCWLRLEDELASRYHARFYVNNGEAELEDLGSRNGTFINGERIVGRRPLADGDRIRIGRELIAVLGAEPAETGDEDTLRRTLAPGEDTRFPSLIGQLVQKSLKVGKLKDAERYTTALTNQLGESRVPVGHPAAESCIGCLLALAERTLAGVWIDRLFKLHAAQGWIMAGEVLEKVRAALDRIARIPGTGLRDYERRLRAMRRDGVDVPSDLMMNVAELADAYAAG